MDVVGMTSTHFGHQTCMKFPHRRSGPAWCTWYGGKGLETDNNQKKGRKRTRRHRPTRRPRLSLPFSPQARRRLIFSHNVSTLSQRFGRKKEVRHIEIHNICP